MVTNYAHEMLELINNVLEEHNPLGYEIDVNGDYEIMASLMLGMALMWAPRYTTSSEDDVDKAIRNMSEYVQSTLDVDGNGIDMELAANIADDILTYGDKLLTEMMKPCDCGVCVAEREQQTKLSVN